MQIQKKVSEWRAQNASQILEKAKKKIRAMGGIEVEEAHPRLVFITLDHGSWHDQDEVQELWAGLLASCCWRDGRDDSNLIFINTLSQMTINEIRIFNYSCITATKMASPGGLIVADTLECDLPLLQAISDIQDIHRLDRELDHLRSLGLCPYGFSPLDSDLMADITPSSLALHMYVRCQGVSGSPLAYFGLV